MHFLAIASIDRLRLSLITVLGIRALIIDLHDHTRSYRTSIGGKWVTLGRDVPALATAFANAGDYFSVLAIDSFLTEVVAAGIGEVVGSREANAMVACC